MDEMVAYFGVDQTAQLVGFSPQTLRKWDQEGLYRPARFLKNRRRPQSRLYSFGDVVVLSTMAEARKLGVSNRELRKLAIFIEQHPETKWSSTVLYIAGSRLFFTYEDATAEIHLLAASPLGQQVMPELFDIKIDQVRERARERIESLSQRDRDELGTTTTNRHIVSGEEVFAGTRIPVTTIVYAIRDGWSDGEILENYPRLTETDIKLARDRSTNSSLVPAG
ncbi:MAG: hypothetical protein MOGMAGMI_01845 [Candidatus Omnitrophica bacterium]|nr:hypothetical protein [Candidatus Omnitrophota bacterium]